MTARFLPQCTAALVVTASLVAAGCGGDAGDTTGTTATGPETDELVPAAPPTATTVPDEAGEAPGDDGVTELITVSGGEVVGGPKRILATEGETVVIAIDSDRDGSVHVHGIDVETAVSADDVSELSVDASIPGVYEVEMHFGEAHLAVAELQVNPA